MEFGFMKPKILRTDAELHIVENALRDLRNIADVVTTDSNNEETLAREAEDADLIITCYAGITARVIESARKLKGIVKYGVGVDNIDLEAATMKGILVVNCPDYGSDTIAEHAFALMLCLAKKIIPVNKVMGEKAWIWPSPEFMGTDLLGKTLGLIGFGKIGRAMARKASAFGMKIIVYDPYVSADLVKEFDAEFVSLDTLLRRSDVVSIHCVLTPETRELIGGKEFRMMKKTAFLIDVSRGAIIDEEAMLKALKENWIAGAGLDVFVNEPLMPGHPLLESDNVILTPHLAWHTKEAYERLESETLQRTLEILEGKIPPNIKNSEVLGNINQTA